MTKIFPKTRLCIIDLARPFEQGIRRAFAFAEKHNISINTADGRRLVASFCVENIHKMYIETPSVFPKATCLSKKSLPNRLAYFLENYFEPILKQMPIHYCGSYELTSPDLEMAAENILKRQSVQRNYDSLLSKLKVRKIA
jgi:hypothetical protein